MLGGVCVFAQTGMLIFVGLSS